MQKTIIFNIVLFLSHGFSIFAQETEPQEEKKAMSFADIALSGRGGDGGSTIFSGALSWYRLHPIALKKRFAIGYGIRYTGAVGQNGDYVTAPAKVSEGNFSKSKTKSN